MGYNSVTIKLRQIGTLPPGVKAIKALQAWHIKWKREGAGVYTGELTKGFPENKTALFVTPDKNSGFVAINRRNESCIEILTYDNSLRLSDNILENTEIEIRVYE